MRLFVILHQVCFEHDITSYEDILVISEDKPNKVHNRNVWELRLMLNKHYHASSIQSWTYLVLHQDNVTLVRIPLKSVLS